MAEPHRVTFEAADGRALVGSLYEAAGDTAVVVGSATAVPRRLYDPLARYLADGGWSVLTFDYRGIGDSRAERLRGDPARMRDWGLLDIPAAVAFALAERAPRRLFYVGHSFGGQAVGMLEDPEPITGAVFLSAQSGYWGLQAPSERLRTRVLVTAVLPVVSRLVGHFPWSRFARGEDLPAGVALEWARWCRSPGYLLDDDTLPLDRFASFRAPVLSYSVDDDVWGSAASVDFMMSAYPDVERRHLVPADHGLRLGHMGYFRASSAPLWPEARAWLDQLPGGGR